MRLQHSQGDCFSITHDTELQATARQAAVHPDEVQSMQPPTQGTIQAHLSSRTAPPACVQQSPAPRCLRAAGRHSGPPCWLCARTLRSSNLCARSSFMTCRHNKIIGHPWLRCSQDATAVVPINKRKIWPFGSSSINFVAKGGRILKMPRPQAVIAMCP